MKKLLQRIWSLWSQFWFEPIDLFPLACTRILLGFTVLYLAVMRLWNSDLYSAESIIPRESALEVIPQYMRPAYGFFFWPDSWSFFMQWVHVILLILLVLGLSKRGMVFFTWVVSLGFLQRNYSAIYGADIISCVFLFYLSFCRSDQHLSILNWTKRISAAPQRNSDILSTVMFRMMQIHLSVIYAYTGLEKLKGLSWWDGTALWTVFGNTQIVMYDFTWLKHFPEIIAFLTFTTILFEVYFPAAMLSSKIRPFWLLAGVLFHLGIGLVMAIFPFSFVMISIYFVFIDPQILRSSVVSIWDTLFKKYSHWRQVPLN